MKVRMQQPELTSSFLLPQSVWLQRCQGRAFLIVFKITVSPFDDANVGNRGRINHGALCSCSYTQKCEMRKHTHTRRCLNIILFLIFSVGFIIFSLFSFCLALTHVITHTNPQLSLSLPLHDAGKRLEFIPAPLLIPPHSSRMHSTHTHTRTCSNTRTHNQQTFVMWLLSAWAAVEMKLC